MSTIFLPVKTPKQRECVDNIENPTGVDQIFFSRKKKKLEN